MRQGHQGKLKAAIFDLDGTLTDTPSIWKHLHEKFGTWDIGKKTERLYYDGVISYEEWANIDASCWKGTPVAELLRALGEIKYTIGARELIAQLKTQGIRTGIVSAGLSLLVDKAKQDLGTDLAISNELEVREGILTGKVAIKVGPSNKPQIIEEAAWLLGADMIDTVAIGDNASDMPEDAGLRIAYKPSTIQARAVADVIIEDDDIRAVADQILN